MDDIQIILLIVFGAITAAALLAVVIVFAVKWAINHPELLQNKDMSVKIMSIERNTLRTFRMKYKYFNGVKCRNLKVREGDSVHVDIEVTSNDGKLGIRITRGDECVFDEPDAQTGAYGVNLDEGRWQIAVRAEKHSGEFSFKW